MAKILLRFKINPPGETTRLPVDAKILHFGFQESRNAWSVWVEAEEDIRAYEERRFEIYPTGAVIRNSSKHIATHITLRGSLVFHLYEV